MIKENAPTFLDRKPLFTGNQCFPLSPGPSSEKNQDGLPIDPNDQLAKIFSLIGTPSEEDKSFVTDELALKYLNVYTYQPRVDLQSKFPGTEANAIDFMDRLLVFNPFFRMTLDEAINHPFLKDIKDKQSDEVIASEVIIDFDNK